MRKLVLGLCLSSLLSAGGAPAKGQRPALSDETRQFVSVDAPAVALTHVRVIDGTGGPALADQTVVTSEGRIQSIHQAAHRLGARVGRLALNARRGRPESPPKKMAPAGRARVYSEDVLSAGRAAGGC